MTTFYWHDYETWGANPAIDRPSQFAGVRTDEDLNIIGEPLVIYCKPPEDVLPHPEACLITGITPQHAREHGLHEAEFIKRIHKELNLPGTCGVGYNSLRFDDEITRYSLYRNFFEPYEREWRNGNSRWDIIDMVRMVYALRPEGIEWPMVDGKPSFKLELLTAANGITHSAAHDAFSDVEATIALAKLIKEKKPQLYRYVLEHKSKQAISKMIDVRAHKPLLHISSKFPSSRGCAGLVVPLAAHPTNKNAVIVYELSLDPSPLEALNAEEIAKRVFVSNEDLPEGEVRLPIKLIHLNKCPILLPTKMLDEARAERFGIDRAACERHWQAILGMELEYKMRELYSSLEYDEKTDPEQRLYEGFLGNDDKKRMMQLREANLDSLQNVNYVFEDRRLNDMLLRYKARSFPASLSTAEVQEWEEFVAQRLSDGEAGILSLPALEERIAQLMIERAEEPHAIAILTALKHYADEQRERFKI